MEPRRHPMRNCFQTRPLHFQKCKHLLGSETNWFDQTGVDLQLHRYTCWASQISNQKEPFLKAEFTPTLNMDLLDAGRSPNAYSPRSSRNCFITMVKLKNETERNSFEKWKSWASSDICEKNWSKRYQLRMQGCLWESCEREVGKEMFAGKQGRGGGGGEEEEHSPVPTGRPARTDLKRWGGNV